MPKKSEKKGLSKQFNKIGDFAIENGKSSYFLGTTFILGVSASIASIGVASSILGMPAIMFGTGVILKKSSDYLENIQEKLSPK